MDTNKYVILLSTGDTIDVRGVGCPVPSYGDLCTSLNSTNRPFMAFDLMDSHGQIKRRIQVRKDKVVTFEPCP